MGQPAAPGGGGGPPCPLAWKAVEGWARGWVRAGPSGGGGALPEDSPPYTHTPGPRVTPRADPCHACAAAGRAEDAALPGSAGADDGWPSRSSPPPASGPPPLPAIGPVPVRVGLGFPPLLPTPVLRLFLPSPHPATPPTLLAPFTRLQRDAPPPLAPPADASSNEHLCLAFQWAGAVVAALRVVVDVVGSVL